MDHLDLKYVSIRKATSVMNIRKSNSSFGINNFGSSRNLSSSQTSLATLRGQRAGRHSLSDGLMARNKVDKRKSLPAGGSNKIALSPQITITEEE